MTEQPTPFTAFANAMLAWTDDPDHARFQQANLVLAALEQAGWKVVQIQEVGCSQDACDDRPRPLPIHAGDLVRVMGGSTVHRVILALPGCVLVNNGGVVCAFDLDAVALVAKADAA